MGIYKIFPAIGVARVGNSLQFYLAPETAGSLPTPLTIAGDGTVQLPIQEAGSFSRDDFRDSDGKMRRQAVRFRIYHYESESDTNPIEVKLGGPQIDGKNVTKIVWKVRVANKKASWYQFQTKNGEDGYAPNHPLRNSDVEGDDNRRALIIDPGSKTIDTDGGFEQTVLFDRAGGGTWPPTPLYPEVSDISINDTTINQLGEMYLDTEGNLIFAGGFGRSGSKNDPPEMQDYANSDGWWDDTSDGTVSAEVFLDGISSGDVNSPAWVLVGPPGYAPQILNMVTLYDTMLDVAVRNMNYRPDIYEDGFWKYDYLPNFEQEIQPILVRASMFPWVTAIPPKPHTFDHNLLGNPDVQYNGLRQYFFSQIRPPNEKNTLKSKTTGYPMMPYLAGDDATGSSQKSSKYLSLTDTQYFLLQQWAEGKFDSTSNSTPDVAEQLTIGSLENCVGGAFSPGIEMTWICRNPKIYSEPFRIKHKPMAAEDSLSLGMNLDEGLEPGDATQFMALPWQADFNECAYQPLDRIVWWWPAQRPLFVYLEDDLTRTDETIQDRQVPWVGTDYDQNRPDYMIFPENVEMVEKWHQLGFVFDIGPKDDLDQYFAEVARSPELPHG